MSHNSSTVLTFVDKLIPDLLSLNPQMEHIHYWTDSLTSQYCQEGLNPKTSCKTWMDEFTVNEDTNTSPMQTQDELDGSNTNTELINVRENDNVAAKYLDKWYVGKVLEVDCEDNTVTISFLEHKKKAFQWPFRKDIIWVDKDQILCKVTQPTSVGTSKRMPEILPYDMKLVEDIFDHK
ncbi:hypothetical protein DPMN_175013 [Dreissena polymorpha]|uniref:Uncharacterized protein n=1 Tax=Dreissena polymorpha TaxID=45954 RepID=A0A9D4IFN0_DREPO|nr:hypothetical protein DPMN_175013 [Dreissena polymorpha]